MSDTLVQRITELEAVVAAQASVVAAKDQQIAQLEKQVQELLAHINRNSRNSNNPPSSDPPQNRQQRRAKERSERKRGGQPGHEGNQRALEPSESVDEVVDLYPPECENCWERLPREPDEHARRSQAVELPPVRPFITEYRQHLVVCPHCRHRTRASAESIPLSPFGPRLCSVVALLTGVYHLSRRSAVNLLNDVIGVRISLGAVSAIEARVSAAVKPAVEEAWEQVQRASVKHTDGTTWLQAGVLCALWTVASKAATVFKIMSNAQKETLQKMLGSVRGILVSDRAKALNFWAMENRQICWAHLLRKFIAFSERSGAAAIGNELLDYVGIMFAYWDEMKTGQVSREKFVANMAPVRQQVEAALQRAVAAGIAHVSGSCADILLHQAALWTFVDHPGVDPTNNHAERELRAFVMWRKRCFGTQSERGNHFAERLMTVTHTARKQRTNVLAFLTACCAAARSGTALPSLFAAAS